MKLDAVTWVANEVIFKSDKKYNNPFCDVDIDTLCVQPIKNIPLQFFCRGAFYFSDLL